MRLNPEFANGLSGSNYGIETLVSVSGDYLEAEMLQASADN
jgi:hypothetical protein